MNYEALLFDCDGVLVDSEAITNGVLCAMLNEAGWALAPDECMRIFIGKTVRSEAARIKAQSKAMAQQAMAGIDGTGPARSGVQGGQGP